MAFRSVSLLKFVGTVSLGLLTGVSYTVSTLALPNLLHLTTSSSATLALNNLTSGLRLPIFALTTFSTIPLLLSFLLSPRSSRHPYLLYTSLLAVLSSAIPNLLTRTSAARSANRPTPTPRRKTSPPRQTAMEASYEVLGDLQSEDAPSEEEMDDPNGEDIRPDVEGLARAYIARAGLAAMGFALAVVGIWGDGTGKTIVIAQ